MPIDEWAELGDAVESLDGAFGSGGWSIRIVGVAPSTTDPDFLLAQVELEAVIENRTVKRGGIGGAVVARSTKTGDAISLGADYAAAVDSAVLHAARWLGRELSRSARQRAEASVPW